MGSVCRCVRNTSDEGLTEADDARLEIQEVGF